MDKLGVTHFIWIPGVKGFDITNYHIDALTRFASPGVVLLSKLGSNAHPIAIEVYNSAHDILTVAKDTRGRTITVIDCEEPDITQLGRPDEHNEVIGSYANYLLVNGGVIMPKFGQNR